ncbi:hypothetical protein EJB05_34773, partial [Eragrostis curvula]
MPGAARTPDEPLPAASPDVICRCPPAAAAAKHAATARRMCMVKAGSCTAAGQAYATTPPDSSTTASSRTFRNKLEAKVLRDDACRVNVVMVLK